MREQNRRRATCHPERRHAAKGQCFECYNQQYPKAKRATCHADRIASVAGLCKVCYDRDLKNRNPGYAQRQKENYLNWCSKNQDYRDRYGKEYRTRPETKQRNRDRARENRLSAFGLTWSDEVRIIEEQGGGCAVCGGPPDRASFDIDHDHATGEFRGFLCGKCNKGLGLLGDAEDTVERALIYLRGGHTANG
jgi:hypothetical protein